MPALNLPVSILCVSSDPSFFGTLKGDKKNPTLSDVTRIDFPLVEKGVIQQENLSHALKSLEQKSLYLVLSDEVFLHHISDYTLNAKTDIEDSIKETVSTVFSDQKDPLHIVTVDLAKTSKMQTVQITAMSKDNLAAIKTASEEAETEIAGILPASFVVKAFVSVDPSLFVLQTPQSFLLTSHYIGVDFAKNVAKDDVKDLISVVKTLKKERPHIQHVYLSADAEELASLHTELEEVLPVQDVEIKQIETENDTPTFLKALCLGVKDVVENDFPLPRFSLDDKVMKVKEEKVKEEKPDVIKALLESDKEEEEKEKEKELPVPAVVAKAEAKEEMEEKVAVEEKEEKKEKVVEKEKEDEKEDEEPAKLAVEPAVKLPEPALIKPPVIKPVAAVAPAVAAASIVAPAKIASVPASASIISPPKTITPPASSVTKEKSPTIEIRSVEDTPVKTTLLSTKKKKGGFMKYVCITFGVALIISLIGGGIIISQQALSDKKSGELQSPISAVTPSPTAEEVTPTPEPTPEPVDLKTADIAVFNATTIAGKAGKVATAVKKAGPTTVATGNAKDKYEAGTYIMYASEEFEGAHAELEKATGLTLEKKAYSATEDPDKKYDIIIILGE
jgi:hypothetical protein